MTNDLDLSTLADSPAGDARGRLLANAEHIKRKAIGRTKSYVRRDGSVVEVEDPDFRSALGAVELAAKLTGAIISKHEVAGRGEFDGWTDEDLDRFIATGVMPARLEQRRGRRALPVESEPT